MHSIYNQHFADNGQSALLNFKSHTWQEPLTILKREATLPTGKRHQMLFEMEVFRDTMIFPNKDDSLNLLKLANSEDPQVTNALI